MPGLRAWSRPSAKARLGLVLGEKVSGLSTHQGAYRAGWLRIVLGLLGIASAKWVFPELARYVPILIAYIASSLVMQVLIAKRIGGEARGLLSGLIDVATLTFIVQRLGSASTMLCSIYVLLGIMMALVQVPRVALSVAVMCTLAYAFVLLLEQLDWLPYAPDARGWAFVKPTARSAVFSGLIMATITISSTRLVSQVVTALQAREEQLRELNGRLETLSQRDPLTQLYNRRYLLERIEQELGRVRRGQPAALLMIDLDRFKAVNDSLGHLRGDELLDRVGSAISRSTREVDVVSRYGGDEFAVLLSNANPEQAVGAAERLVEAISAAARQFEAHCSVTASVGVAFAEETDDTASLLRRADDRAYEAKQRGGDRIAYVA